MGTFYWHGKSRGEVEQWNESAEDKLEEKGFQKHSCIQFCITSQGFENY